MAFDANGAVRSVVGMIVGVLVSAILIGALLPVGVDFILDANTTGWGTEVVAIFDLFPLIFVLVPFIAVVAWIFDVI